MEHINKGWLSLEMSGAILIIMLAIIASEQLMSQYLDNQEWAAIAQKSTVISDAAQRYIADNYSTLTTQAAPGKALPIPVSTLISTGYLRAGYVDTNTYGQQYEAVVVKNSKQPDQLDSYVVTQKGRPLNEKGMRAVASGITGMGGYTKNGQAVGAFSGWTQPLSQLGLSIPDGHIVVDLTNGVLNTANDESDRLYRYKVDTRPELNQMHTDIDMAGNSVSNGNDIAAQTGSFEKDISSHSGSLVTHNNNGWTNQTHNGGFYMDDDDWVKSLNGKGISTTGQLKGGTVRADDRLSGGEFLQLDGIAVAGTSCDTNGLIGHESNGVLITCQNRVWTENSDLKQNECLQTGNTNGRDFDEHRCPLGWYAAGLKFDGHRNNESTYVVICCH